ncbi:acyl-CoA dehydrogenase family protein [Telmatospirillum sp.]|uniref:acyl-CoA dehydrogenase family protein n=1 Tax=Telmatospirillum sp. TaxID=2079197 RepID=UPI002850B715|nr:acyl-CoA dehydrogenase family protein [Telmatospirillum sp.]MDR3438164.1 acyl-CoA dehydrogenase family protein [Telmatospirillum sp.]
MDFGLSEEQKMIVGTVRRFVTTELRPLEDEIATSGHLDPDKAKEIFKKSKELGLYAMNMPEELGGGGLCAVDTMLVEEQFGHTSDILIRRAFGNVYEVMLKCNEEQRKTWLLPSIQGERTGSIAITEAGAGSDAAGISTRAVKDGDGWKLSGQKCFVSDGLYSDYFIVSAVTDPDSKPKGISLFLVDKNMPGVTVGRDQLMMGLVGSSHIELFFDDVKLGREHLLGQEGMGLRHALETLGRVRLAQVGARAIGKSTHILELMTDYARDRRQFNKAIGEFQLVQQMLADSVIELNAARLMVLNAAWEIDQGRDGRDQIAMVKVHAAETLGRIADRGVQVFGGMGFCRELPIERLYRDARVYRIFDGTSEIHRTVIARSLLKRGKVLFDVPA